MQNTEVASMATPQKRELKPEQRLILAADFRPNTKRGENRNLARRQLLMLADEMHGTGVCFKMNSILRACGYHLIAEVQSRGLDVFADLNLIDIGETLATDGVLLRGYHPTLVSAMCVAGVGSLQALKAELPETEVLGVTVLTSLEENDTEEMFHATVESSAMRFALLAETVGLDGLICAPTDIASIRSVVKRSMTFNTPAVRPTWAIVPGDDQNLERIMTPTNAIKAGADRIIVGRPIVNALYRRQALMRTLEEIEVAMQLVEL
ncbi:MAG: hypothetical protein EXS69_01480 [Candidatus Zambryskibacteria bacterium]|nr:hypothetical protein [Candidatus Zambryskibacteria bacterium]